MSYKINEKEIENVLSRNGEERYYHFIARVSDWEELWGLKDKNGWVTAEDDEGEKSIPFWPHEEYARLCANGSWQGNDPTPIELSVFIEKWLPGMEKDGLLVAVFPTPSEKSLQISPSKLKSDLEEECGQYE